MRGSCRNLQGPYLPSVMLFLWQIVYQTLGKRFLRDCLCALQTVPYRVRDKGCLSGEPLLRPSAQSPVYSVEQVWGRESSSGDGSEPLTLRCVQCALDDPAARPGELRCPRASSTWDLGTLVMLSEWGCAQGSPEAESRSDPWSTGSQVTGTSCVLSPPGSKNLE